MRLIRADVQKVKGKKTEREADQNAESDDTIIDTVSSSVILGCLPDEVLASLDKSVVDEIKRIEPTNPSVLQKQITVSTNLAASKIS